MMFQVMTKLATLERPDGIEAIVVESNEEAVYAYFWESGSVNGFVWLFNIAAVPPENFGEKRQAPANPLPYAGVGTVSSPLVARFKGVWKLREGVIECAIYMDSKLIGVLGKGDKPGWSMFAALDGPLALRLLD
ncbi:MAG: hypothetical protein JSS66_08135 [Armatimonadetes bacterium]|nr:hypothetical protein [Armatimonadota bacterium]